MDKVMKHLGIEVVALHGKEVKPIVHCNVQGRPMGGGRNNWLTRFWSYALKLNLAINDIRRGKVEWDLDNLPW